MKKNFLLLMLFSLVFMPSVFAANWYVDKDAPEGGNGQSWITAWRNFSSIQWSSIQPGDTIYISGGTSEKVYNEQIYVLKSGAPGARIRITKGVDAGHDGKVIFDNSNQTISVIGTPVSSTVEIRNYKHIEVSGLTIMPGAAGGGKIAIVGRSPYGAEDILIKDNWINSSVGPISLSGFNVPKFSSDYVHNINITGNVLIVDVVNTRQTDGIYMQYVQNIFITDNYVLVNNKNDKHNDLLQTAHIANNLTIARNYFLHLARKSAIPNNADNGFMMNHLDGVIKIYDNIIATPNFDTSAGISVFLAGGGDSTCYNFSGQIVCPYLNYSPLIYFYNNVVFADKAANAVTIIYENRGVSQKVDNRSEIKNNIFYGTAGYNQFQFSSLIPAQNIDYNLYFTNGTSILRYNSIRTLDSMRSVGGEIHGINANPLFVDISNRNYKLLETSPAIDAGLNLGDEFRVALDRVSRPQGAGWDIGAYEYVSSGSFHPADTNQNGCIELNEISAYIGLWLNNQGVTLSEASSAVSTWLGGC